jgi:3-phenylpropionate/trans-cinnamate dioxygenase ferredoxin subunit
MNDTMDNFVAVAKTTDLAPGSMMRVTVENERVVLARVEDKFYALRDACGHISVPLSFGTLEGYFIECPRHYALFDVRDGAYITGPMSANVPSYEVRVDGDTIYVRRPAEP